MLPKPLQLLLPLLLVFPAHADSVTISTGTLQGSLNGLRNGKISLTLPAGTERLLELSDISSLSLDAFPAFAQAEAVRSDPLKAVALYKALIPTLNKPELKLLAEARAIEPFDRNGNWTDATVLFLDVYQNSPTDAIFKLHPTHLPAPTSRMLPDSAEKIAAILPTIKSDEARKNLRVWLLELYTRAGDTQSAERLAREISTGAIEPAASNPAADPALAATLANLESALAARNYDRVLQQTASLLATTPSDSAAQLYSLQARALEGQQKLDLAAAAWLRIPAHYPSNRLAPTALLNAAILQQKLKHPQETQALLEELRSQYPNSPETASLPKP